MASNWLVMAAVLSLFVVVPVACSAMSAGLFAVVYPAPDNAAEYRRKDRRAMIAWAAWLGVMAGAVVCEALGL